MMVGLDGAALLAVWGAAPPAAAALKVELSAESGVDLTSESCRLALPKSAHPVVVVSVGGLDQSMLHGSILACSGVELVQSTWGVDAALSGQLLHTSGDSSNPLSWERRVGDGELGGDPLSRSIST